MSPSPVLHYLSLVIVSLVLVLVVSEPQSKTLKWKRSAEIDVNGHPPNMIQDNTGELAGENQSSFLIGHDGRNLTRNLSVDELMELELMQEFAIRDPLSIAIPMTLIYSLILLSGLVGNISTCVVIFVNPYMHTATNYYLFSLAMSDLLLLISGVPQEIYLIWKKYPYIFGEVICVIRGLAAETSANATVLTITAFTVERFVAIVYPLKSHMLSQLTRVKKLCGLIWMSSLVLAIPQAAQFGVMDAMSRHDPQRVLIKRAWCTLVRESLFPYAFQISICVFFVIPMTIITILYILIGLKLRRSRRKGPLNPEPRTHPRGQQSHVIRMLIAVVVGFFICWFPFHGQRLMALYANSVGREKLSTLFLKVYKGLMHVSGILYYLSTCINPILYHIMSNKFRQAFKDTMAQLCGHESDSHLAHRNYSIASNRSNRLGYLTTGSNNSLTGTGSGVSRNKGSPAPSSFNSNNRRQQDMLDTIEESEKHADSGCDMNLHSHKKAQRNSNSSAGTTSFNMGKENNQIKSQLSSNTMDSLAGSGCGGYYNSNSPSEHTLGSAATTPTHTEIVVPMSLLEKKKSDSTNHPMTRNHRY